MDIRKAKNIIVVLSLACVALIYLIFSLLFREDRAFVYTGRNNEYDKVLLCFFEFCYFKGQRDAMLGDIRITKKDDGRWDWIKSPWNDGSEPLLSLKSMKEEDVKRIIENDGYKSKQPK